MANWIRLGTAQEEAVAAQDAATRAERAENAVRNAANALTEIVATLQELADEYQTKALQVALQHALDTKDQAHEALTAAEHASFGAFNAFDATQAELYACCSASPFDPPESKRINVLPRRSASNLRA